MRKSTKWLTVIGLFGAVGGYVAGILTAPKSGKETRKDIKDTAIKARTEAEKQLKKLHSELNQLIGTGKVQAKRLGTEAKSKLARTLAKAQASKEKARAMLSSLHEGGAADEDIQAVIKDVKQAVNHLSKFIQKHESSNKKPAKNKYLQKN